MLTVAQAARRVGRDPTTIRRWISAGPLRAERVGTHHVIRERDADKAAKSDMVTLPPGWDRTIDSEPMPDVVAFQAWRIAEAFGWKQTYDAEHVALAHLLDCRLPTR